MPTSLTRSGLLVLGLTGLLLAPHSASALGYIPAAPDLTVINGTAMDNGTSTAVTGQFSFAPGSDTTTTNFMNGVETDNSSSIVFTGGAAQYVTTKDNSTATLAGGTFRQIAAKDNSTVTISGGKFFNLYTFGNGTINLIGSNLTATFSTFAFDPSYNLTGTLSDGTVLNGNYESGQGDGGRILFNGVFAAGVPSAAPVPEASSVVSLGLMLVLGAGGFVIARRKKAGAAV